MIEQNVLESIVGAGNVTYEQATLDDFSRDISFVNKMTPTCVVTPTTQEAVQQLIQSANETRTPLVPVSSGTPRFRGDTVPSTGGAVIVDLSKLKKIVFVDRPRRVAMVEPGVTFGELIPEATREGIRLNMPLLPRKTKSIIGSVLEKEPVVMPGYQWDVGDPLACAGLYWGNGEEFRTGQAAGPGTIEEQWKVDGKQKAPYGPGTACLHRILQGAQGTMGIVTWMSIRCELLPTIEESFVVGSDDLDKLLELNAWLVRLRMVTECFILNATNVASMFAYDADDYKKIKDSLPPYILFYTLPGYKYHPEERIKVNVEKIGSINQGLGLSPEKSVGIVSADEMRKTFQKPSEDPYWKIRHKGAGQDIFYVTTSDQIKNQINLTRAIADKHGYATSDLGIYIQSAVQGTSYHCEFNLFYDPSDQKESAQVKSINAEATRNLLNNSAFFSRPYGEETGMIMNRDSATLGVLNRLKSVFDPNNILNPGKMF